MIHRRSPENRRQIAAYLRKIGNHRLAQDWENLAKIAEHRLQQEPARHRREDVIRQLLAQALASGRCDTFRE
jgi:hypothetical protein